ncbi:hypothetical protein [Ponticaulis sp.]|uniref:hypothetical protein n=1 Tax=Ponticaulis sp. TaxID=2020902 RepID=UPI00261543AB|nr:hypothetical protein [Ponticaulis sp.]MDF1679622.1 hypothetical protein [Ponticaulis sp.]
MILARRLALIVGLISLLVGIIAMSVMSYELLFPGLQLFTTDYAESSRLGTDTWIHFISAHYSALMAAMPLAILAGVCISQLKMRVAPAVSIGMSLVSLLLIFAPGILGVTVIGGRAYLNEDLMLVCLAALSASVFIACVCLLIRRKVCTVSVIYAAVALLFLAAAGLHSVVLQNSGPDAALLDTVYLSAAEHSAFLALLLLMFSVLSGLSERPSNAVETAIACVHALFILVVGGSWLYVSAVLGLNGMPLGYADYAYGFRHFMFIKSVSEFVLLGLILAGYIFWMIRGWTVKTVVDERPDTF